MLTGDLNWGIRGRQVNGDLYGCLYLTYKKREFINVLAPIAWEQTEVEIITEICDMSSYMIRRTVLMLAHFGLAHVVEKFAYRKAKFTYFLDIEEGDDKRGFNLDPDALPMN